jgi:hypothetical protein
MSRTFLRSREAAMIWLRFQRGRRRFSRPCAAVRIFGLAAASFSDLSGSPGDGTLPRFQKEVKFQTGNRSALNAGQACAIGMHPAVLFANENKSASGETKIMTDPRQRR